MDLHYLVAAFRLVASELWWLSGGKCGILSELLRAVFCTTVVHNGMHTNISSC